jgi:2-dehydropantoate 2-reductase
VSGAGPGRIAVVGAGAIGCWVGGRLRASGVDVCLVGRPRVLNALRQNGLVLTDLMGGRLQLKAQDLWLAEEPPGEISLVLLCVKSQSTADATRALVERVPSGTAVVSWQNGVMNARIGAQAAPQLVFVPGMVPYNVAEVGPGHFHRGTVGDLAAQDHASLHPWLPVFAAAGMPIRLHADLRPVQWAKLLLNLNNPVNALSGLPLRAQLLDRDYRVVLAALMNEALAAMAAAGIAPARLTAVPARWLPAVMRLPNGLFRRIAARLLRIDEQARSSMADDLARGRSTEIDALCGEVVRLAQAHGLAAPLNQRMVEWLSVPRPQPQSGPALRRALSV